MSPVECYNHCITEPGLGEMTDDNLEEYIVLYQMCKEFCGITGENHCIELKWCAYNDKQDIQKY